MLGHLLIESIKHKGPDACAPEPLTENYLSIPYDRVPPHLWRNTPHHRFYGSSSHCLNTNDARNPPKVARLLTTFYNRFDFSNEKLQKCFSLFHEVEHALGSPGRFRLEL